ncbi:MAG: pilus assembly protein PilM [Candidatus Wallbacteria bacterium]
MGLFGGTPKVSVGLDIGNAWVKMVQMTISGSGRPSVTKIACEKNVSDARSAVSKILRENTINPSKTTIVVSLDGQDTEMIINEFPAKNITEASKQAELKMKEFDTMNYAISFSPLRGPVISADGNSVFPVLYVSAEKSKVETFQNQMRECGIPLDGLVLDIDVLAAVNALEIDQNGMGSVCLIEGGALTTNISVLNDGVLRYTTTIKDDGGAVITSNVAREIGISRDEAEKMKLNDGISFSNSGSRGGLSLELTGLDLNDAASSGDDMQKKYFNAIKSEFERYFDKIVQVLKNYEEQFPGNKVNDIVLTGGLACVKNISGFMTNYLKNNGLAINAVAIGDSPYLSSLNCPDEERQVYTVALGLALRGLAE